MSEKALRRIPLERLMDLKVDYAFKQLFGSNQNKEITVVFLNAILKRTGRDIIKDISFSNIEIGGEYEDDKQSRLDLLVVTQADEWINIEIQFTNKFDMVNRTLYYWSRIYSKPMTKGKVYSQLTPVITINILNFDLINETDLFHSTYSLYEATVKHKLTNMIEIHFIEIPQLIRDWYAKKLDPWNDILARWLLLLGIVDHRKGKIYGDIYKELEAIALKDKQLAEAFNHWQNLSLSDDEYFAYEGRLKRIKDEEAVIIEAELRVKKALEELDKALEKGLEQGIQQGIEQGIERGIERGIEQGRLNRDEEIIQNSLEKNIDVKTIAEVTGHSIEYILEVKKKLNL
ncbi:Rpn family recombination-promoting nuclease/putative transposase [Lysinibacillus antri]|uniref:Rpn family recombination-promoting nuclease/putative transposase n=1 Tax=Lysinibacillus antri TaxID=2498145 RepID=A0A3S0WG32_9BACI|nr:Rpn family recombination-promoting nuclease/putative transposase [Lysinibacillus antri]RUL52015.1 Rpn family recombination-promoting nuclease/putative transposase [Lysinibacillus antri]